MAACVYMVMGWLAGWLAGFAYLVMGWLDE
jgi:hypothetical protein